MRLFLDERELDAKHGRPTTVGEAIAAAAAIALERGRLVIEVTVDGEPWSSDDLDALAGTGAAASADEVRITTADQTELLSHVLRDADEAAGQALALQSEAAEQLQVGDNSAGFATLGEALSLWQSVHQAVTQCADVAEIDLETVFVSDRAAPEIISHLGSLLATLHDQLLANDPAAAADTLLYDLPEVQEQWRELLTQLRLHAKPMKD